MRKIVANCAFLIACLSCIKPPSPERPTQRSSATVSKAVASASPDLQVRTSATALTMVSAFTLDTISFTILGVSVGLQNFMDSQAPLLAFQLPRDADYVEVLRCPSNAVILSGSKAISIANLPSIIASQSDLMSFYQQNDIFNGAAQSSACMLVADALTANSFVDTIAPSGNYSYLLRACVNPVRLTDAARLSSRNCSLVVAVSPILNDFVNKQQEDILEHLRKAASYSSKLDAIGLRMQYIAAQANTALNYCETQGHSAQVAKVVRDSWATLGAATIETILDVKGSIKDTKVKKVKNKNGVWETAINPRTGEPETIPLPKFRDQLKDAFVPFSDQKYDWWDNAGNAVQGLQLIGDLQGFILTDTTTKLVSQSKDFPRSCAPYHDLITQIQIAEVDLAAAGLGYAYYRTLAQLAHKKSGPAAASGRSDATPTERESGPK